MRLTVLIAAALLALAELALGLRLLRARAARPRSARLAFGLAVCAPAALGLLLVWGLHLERGRPFAAVGQATAASKQALLTTALGADPLSGLGSLHRLAGLGLAVLALCGLLASLCALVERRRAGEPARQAACAGAGMSLAGGIAGAAALWIDSTGPALWAAVQANAGQALAARGAEAAVPPWLVLFAIGLALACGALGMLAAWRSRAGRLERPAVAASLAVLALGLLAFGFTGMHASDVDRELPRLLGTAGPDGQVEPVRAVESALLFRFEPLVERPRPAADLELPASRSRDACRSGIDLGVSMSGLAVQGHALCALEAGEVPAGELHRDGTRIVPLFDLLERYRDARAADPDARVPVSLQADRRLRARTVIRVLFTAAMAGFPDFDLVVRGQRGLPSRIRLLAVPGRVPTCGNLPGGQVAAAGSLLDRARAPGAVHARERGAGELGLVLDVQIRKDGGLHVAASGERPLEELEDLRREIPARPDGGPDLDALAAIAALVHAREPASRIAIALPDAEVRYGTLIAVLDAVRHRLRAGRLEPLFSEIVLSRIIE
ncbi:MAG: hypothetical protein JXR96_09695 [Deltaproteobacteria bacterium]|nr:hypothetical protein [Deltaproteobacteria bacterium]